jgi:hypothetical protein
MTLGVRLESVSKAVIMLEWSRCSLLRLSFVACDCAVALLLQISVAGSDGQSYITHLYFHETFTKPVTSNLVMLRYAGP